MGRSQSVPHRSGLGDIRVPISSYLRCAVAGIVGGLVLITTPDLNMFWQGVALLAIGCLTLGLWAWTSTRPAAGTTRRPPQAGPTFDADDPESADVATGATGLVERVRRERRGRGQSGD
jgi:hypothetical protein